MAGVNNRGFTIIEVMIALAVGGLILSIVFLAIPTLQRNGNNNQRKQDISAILGAISQYQLNHSGGYPDPDVGTDAQRVLDSVKKSYYTTSGVSIKLTNQLTTNDTTVDTVVVQNRSKCSAQSGGQPTSDGAGFSDMVALYSVATSNGSEPQCMEQ